MGCSMDRLMLHDFQGLMVILDCNESVVDLSVEFLKAKID